MIEKIIRIMRRKPQDKGLKGYVLTNKLTKTAQEVREKFLKTRPPSRITSREHPHHLFAKAEREPTESKLDDATSVTQVSGDKHHEKFPAER